MAAAPAPARVLAMPAAASRRAPLITSAVAHLLSPSQVNEWLDCSARWYYHHALGLPDKRTAALAIGEALHAITAACLRIWQRGMDPTRDVAAQVELVLMTALETVQLDPDETPAAIVTQAQAMLAVWLRDIAPQLRETAVLIEERFEGRIAGVRVQGSADVITQSGMIWDLKTSSKKPAGVSQAHRLQLTTYAMLAEQTSRGRAHNAARLVTITKTKTPAAVPQTVEITDADRVYAEWAYATAHREMQDGGAVFPRRSSLLCSRANCAYWQVCESEYGGCVRD